MPSSLAALAAAAALVAVASAQECAADDGQCRAKVPAAAQDHVLLQLASDPKGHARGAARHRAHPKAARRAHHCHSPACPEGHVCPKTICKIVQAELVEDGTKETAGAQWKTQDFDRRDFINMSKLTLEEEKTVEQFVLKAATLENSEEDIAGGDHEKNNVDRETKDEETDEFYGVPANKDIQKSAKVLKEAVEAVAESLDEDEALKEGVEVTAGLLMKLNGLKESPETTTDISAFEGDMIAGNPNDVMLLQEAADNTQRNGRRWAGRLWPSEVLPDGSSMTSIYFCFAGDIHPRIQRVFLEATAQYERLVPCMGFVEVTKKTGRATDPEGEKQCESGDKKAIFVQSKEGGGCNSQVGVMEQPVTRLQLDPLACDNIGTAIHELGHAIGMGHEQARVDRDNYVKVYWENIAPGKKNAFEIDSMEGGFAAPFDPNSIMSFGGNFFSKDPKKDTMKLIGTEAVGSIVRTTLGNRHGLSPGDVKQVATMYGCGQNVGSLALCSSEPGQCTTGECECHAVGKGIIKVTDESGECHSCVEQCPDDGSTCSKHPGCGCPKGFKKNEFQTDSGDWCYACALPQPTGTLTTVEMTRPMEKLLGSGMPFKDIIASIKDSFAKRPPDEVTVERGEGTITVTTKSKRPTPAGIRTQTKTQSGTWGPHGAQRKPDLLQEGDDA